MAYIDGRHHRTIFVNVGHFQTSIVWVSVISLKMSKVRLQGAHSLYRMKFPDHFRFSKAQWHDILWETLSLESSWPWSGRQNIRTKTISALNWKFPDLKLKFIDYSLTFLGFPKFPDNSRFFRFSRSMCTMDCKTRLELQFSSTRN